MVARYVLFLLLLCCAAPGRAQTLGGGPTSASSFLIGEQGQLYGWGNNEIGQLGIGGSTNRSIGQLLPSPEGVRAWKGIAAGTFHTLALAEDGRLYVWGFSMVGQLGLGNTIHQRTAQLLPFPDGVSSWSAIRAGEDYSLAIGSDGRIYTWGSSLGGRLGFRTDASRILVPAPLEFPGNATSWSRITSGNDFSLAITNDGKLYAWGSNMYGTLGIGEEFSAATPREVELPAGVGIWRDVSAGENHAVAIGDDGRLYAWGRNEYGEVGDRTTITRRTPVLVASNDDAETSAVVVAAAMSKSESAGKLGVGTPESRLGAGTTKDPDLIVWNSSLFFASESFDLKPESWPPLERLAAILKETPGLRVEITGHTDDQGDDDYNRRLSERRADAVLEYLVKAGCRRADLAARGLGSSKPVVANDSDENRARNRRVEARFVR